METISATTSAEEMSVIENELEGTEESDDMAPTDFLDTEENVEEYLLEAIANFTDSDYEEDMRWDHPEACPGMFADHGGLIIRTEIDGEEVEYRITIERI